MREIYDSIRIYLSSLSEYISSWWTHLTPQKYVTLLILVGFIGWIMMRNQAK